MNENHAHQHEEWRQGRRQAMVEWIRANPGGEFVDLVAAMAPREFDTNQPLSQIRQIYFAFDLAKSFRMYGVGQDCQGRLWWYEDNAEVDYFIEHDGVYPNHHPLARNTFKIAILWEGLVVHEPARGICPSTVNESVPIASPPAEENT